MIKSYLKQIIKLKLGKPQESFYKWVLKNGKSFKEIDDDWAELKYASNEHKQRQCYYNSQMFALGGKFEYWEGWYVTEGINLPLEHGWNVLNDKVIDVTAHKRFNVNEYFGVKIPINYVRKMLVKTGYSDGYLGRYYFDEIRVE